MRFTSFFFALAGLAVTNAVQANLIVNGGFEAPELIPGTSGSVAAPGWSPNIYVFGGGAGYPWPAAYEGTQYADISNLVGPVYTQVFHVADSGQYTFSWAENTGYYPGGSGTSPYSVSILSGSGLAFSGNYNAFNYGAWELNSATVTLTGSEFYFLSFAPQGSFGGFDTLIDAVSLVAAPSSAVPDATSSGVSILVAVGGMVLGSRFLNRRK